MKKTVTANISGMVFHIDEDAYERLGRYLKNVQNHFQPEEGSDEILSDIEGRIAEMFQEKISPHKKVITIDDVREAINQLGEPEQMAEPEEPQKNRKSKHKQQTGTGQRRLYRDPDDKYIAGVSGGLGAFFNLDPTWIRVAFVVTTFIYGFGPLLYLILWIVVPKARTTAEKLEMRGEKVNISNIEKSIREELEDLKENIKEFSGEAKETFKKKEKTSEKKESKTSNKSGFIAFLGKGAGIVLVFFALLMLAAFISSLFWIPFSIHLSHGLVQLSVPEILTLFLSSPLMEKLALTAFLLILGIPILWIIMLAIKLLFDIKKGMRYPGLITFILWLGGIVMLMIVAIAGARNFAGYYSHTEEHTIDTNDWQQLHLTFDQENLPGNFNYSDFNKVAKWKMHWYSHESDATGVPNLHITTSNDSQAKLLITRKSRGINSSQARMLAGEIEYAFEQIDSLLILDPLFFYPKQNGWRNQDVSLRLSLPQGNRVVLGTDFQKTFPVRLGPKVEVVKE